MAARRSFPAAARVERAVAATADTMRLPPSRVRDACPDLGAADENQPIVLEWIEALDRLATLDGV